MKIQNITTLSGGAKRSRFWLSPPDDRKLNNKCKINLPPLIFPHYTSHDCPIHSSQQFRSTIKSRGSSLQINNQAADSTMQGITRINHIGLRVTDLAITRAFYQKLGFKFIVGPIGPEPVAIMEYPSGVNINFILNASKNQIVNMLMDLPEKYTGYTHVALEVTDMQSTQAYLESINYEVTEGPIVTSEGATFIIIRDPDKNVIEFHLPAK